MVCRYSSVQFNGVKQYEYNNLTKTHKHPETPKNWRSQRSAHPLLDWMSSHTHLLKFLWLASSYDASCMLQVLLSASLRLKF